VSNDDSAAGCFNRLREEASTDALFDVRDWNLDEWADVLATDQPIESVRVLELPALPWSAATLARFAVVFPRAESLTIRWRSVGDAARPTLREALTPWWSAKLTTLVCDFAQTWGEDELAAAPPAFASTLVVLRLRKLRHEECAKALRSIGPLPQLRELDAGCVGDPGALFERLPSLRSLACEVDAKFGLDVSFESDAIESLSIAVRQRSHPLPLRVQGAVPSLRSLTFVRAKDSLLDLDALSALASSARAPLESLRVEAPDAWRIAAAIGSAVFARHGAGPTRASVRRTDVRDAASPEAFAARTDDFASLRSLRATGTAVDPTSFLALVDREAHLNELATEVASIEALDLHGDVHSFLLERGELFSMFPRARSLDFFNAHALTSDAFEALLRAMPQLARMELTNNHNPAMTRLCVRSPTLESLCLTHFHQLRTWEFDAPKLESLELDNCDANSDGEVDRRYQAGDGIIYGDFSERVCAAILDGAPSAKLPALRILTLWNNPYAVGPLLAVESMRVSIDCAQGHPVLERLTLANVTHVRSLTLKRVPKLQYVGVSQYDDEGDGTTWLERVDLADVPAGCEIDLCSLSPGRLGLSAP
jgi:hypothetical protein